MNISQTCINKKNVMNLNISLKTSSLIDFKWNKHKSIRKNEQRIPKLTPQQIFYPIIITIK